MVGCLVCVGTKLSAGRTTVLFSRLELFKCFFQRVFPFVKCTEHVFLSRVSQPSSESLALKVYAVGLRMRSLSFVSQYSYLIHIPELIKMEQAKG